MSAQVPTLIAGTNIVDPASVPKVQAPAPTQPATGSAPAKLLQLIRPTARDRWVTSVLSYYTPEHVENICRSAMSGNLIAQWLMFDLMEQTWPRLSKNLNELKLNAQSLPRIVRPFADKDEKPTPEAVRRAKIVDKLLRTMRSDRKKLERDLDETLYDVLDAVGKGIELSQIIWEQRPVKIDGATNLLWAPRCTQWVHPRYYGFPPGVNYEEQLMLNAREIGLSNPNYDAQSNDNWIPIPDNEFVISIIQQKTGHPVNSSLFRVLAVFWAMSNFTWEWFLNFAQIFGAPIRWATYDPATSTQETIDLIEDMLALMGSMGYAAFPAGTQLELKEAMKSGQDNPQKMLLDATDLICDILIFWEAMTSQHGGPMGSTRSGGTLAAASAGMDKRTERIQSVGNTGCKIISESLVRAICRLNFGDDTECPELLVVTKANKSLVEQAQRYQILLQIPGVTVSKQQFYEDNELTMPDGAADILVGGQQSGGGEDDKEADDAENDPTLAQGRGHHRCCTALARDGATNKLADKVLENLTGIEARWLGGVKPVFVELIAKAKDGKVSDADFIKAVEHAQKHMPELFHKLDTKVLQDSMFNTMSAAAINGAVRGYVTRGHGRKVAR